MVKGFKQFVNEDLGNFYRAAADSFALEDLPGSNKGSKVKSIQSNVNSPEGSPWCAAFVYTVFKKCGFPEDVMKKIPKEAGVFNMWKESKEKAKTYDASEILKDPKLIKPGMIFFFLSKDDKGNYPGHGHTGIILSSDPVKREIVSVEGNTNPIDGSREGFGTFLIKRKIDDLATSKDPKYHPAKFLGLADYISDYREEDNKEYKQFINELPKLIDFYKRQTDISLAKLKKDPELLDQYEENYKNRNKDI